jgi:MFS family permease
MSIKSVRRSFFILKFLSEARAFTHTVYVLFLLQNGLQFWEAMLPNVVYHLTLGLIDPITGFLGDIFGHLRIYTLGLILVVVGEYTYFSATSVEGFMLAEFVLAVGFSLMSDALETWLTYHQGVSKTHTDDANAVLFVIAGIIPAMIGAWVGEYVGTKYTFLLSMFVTLLMLGYSLYLLRIFTDASSALVKLNGEKLWEQMFDGIKQLATALWQGISQRELRYAFFITFITNGAFQSLNMLWAPILVSLGTKITDLGIIWMFAMIGIAVGPQLIKNQTNPSNRNVGIMLLTIAIPIAISSLGLNSLLFAVGFIIHEAGRSAFRVSIKTYVNHRVNPTYRATMLSSISAARWLGGTTFLLIIFVLGRTGLITTMLHHWVISAGLLFFLAFWSLLKK